MGSRESWRWRASSSRRLATARGSKGMAADPFRSPLLGEYRAAGLRFPITPDWEVCVAARAGPSDRAADPQFGLRAPSRQSALRAPFRSSLLYRDSCLSQRQAWRAVRDLLPQLGQCARGRARWFLRRLLKRWDRCPSASGWRGRDGARRPAARSATVSLVAAAVAG